MCAEYEIRTKKNRIEEALNHSVVNLTGTDTWEQHVKLTMRAPVISLEDDKYVVKKLVFPAHPFPNARLTSTDHDLDPTDPDPHPDIELIYQKKTWQTGFQKERCLALASTFLEPAYWGPNAGKVVRFSISDEEIFFIAAIGIRPNKPATGKRDGYALITDCPTRQMIEHHHRSVVVFKPKEALGYLNLPASTPPYEIYSYVRKNRYIGPLNLEVQRQMAKGWEKRVDDHLADRNHEITFMKALKREGLV